jgi:hypothetical protein
MSSSTPSGGRVCFRRSRPSGSPLPRPGLDHPRNWLGLRKAGVGLPPLQLERLVFSRRAPRRSRCGAPPNELTEVGGILVSTMLLRFRIRMPFPKAFERPPKQKRLLRGGARHVTLHLHRRRDQGSHVDVSGEPFIDLDQQVARRVSGPTRWSTAQALSSMPGRCGRTRSWVRSGSDVRRPTGSGSSRSPHRG